MRNVLFEVFKETSGSFLFLLDEFGTAVFVEELGVSGVDVGDVEDLVEVELTELFLVDTTDTVGAVTNDSLLFILYRKFV